jgi:hypothetical protein
MREKKIQQLKEAITKDSNLNSEEKTLSVKKIEEWYTEDQAIELLPEQLINISKKVVPILEEIGLL